MPNLGLHDAVLIGQIGGKLVGLEIPVDRFAALRLDGEVSLRHSNASGAKGAV